MERRLMVQLGTRISLSGVESTRPGRGDKWLASNSDGDGESESYVLVMSWNVSSAA